MRKSLWPVIVIIIIILAVGGYFIFHKSSKPTYGNNNPPASSQNNQTAASNAVFLTKNGSSGQYLTDPSGKPLYTYNADKSGVSNCTGSCLTAWPPYVATASMANLPTGVSTITRTDTHQVQYTFNGLPLYYFTSDTAGSAPTGNGVQNFALATPSTSASSSSNASSGNPY